MKVLIIDDEEDVRKIAVLSLVHVGGMDVREASGGAEGLRLAAAEKPDAILLDVSMPGMDGPTTLAALKADPVTAPIPVIFVTARAMEKEIEDLKALGAEGVLTKPFNAMNLAEDVRAMLGKG